MQDTRHIVTYETLLMRTYDINEVAEFLRIDRTTALQLAADGALPGAKVGRAWVFLEEEVVGYLRDVTRTQTQVRRSQLDAKDALGISATSSRRGGKTRRRSLPELPELLGEVTATQVRVAS